VHNIWLVVRTVTSEQISRITEESMTESQSYQDGKTPMHLWVVGVLGLLWSSIGAMDYVMTQTRNESYMSGFTPEQLEFIYGLPVWVDAAWAIGVWGGVLGAIFLLLRKGMAVWILLASLLAVLVTNFHNYVLSNGMEVSGDTFSLVLTATIFLIALGLYLYSRSMQRRGLLT
jgi:hypothetical protein